MKFESASDIGLVRAENQDNVLVTEIDGNILAVLCDGMGGERSGREASQMAMDTMVNTFKKMYYESDEKSNLKNLLLLSAFSANSAVYEEASANPEKAGMGTTCVSAIVTESKIHIVNIGDSRAYIYDGENLKLITSDHTLVNMLLTQGEITQEEAFTHPYRNMLIKAVGIETSVFPDYFEIEKPENFILLLCSDGLSGYCSSEEIENVIKSYSFENLTEEFVKLALGKGGSDNISVAVITE